jgi:protein-tyrosine-phosphatase
MRSLGKRGIAVVVGASRQGTAAGRSRYARGEFAYPHPISSPVEFRGEVLAAVRAQGAALIIPLTDATCAALAAGREDFSGHGRLPLASNEALAIVLSRTRTRELAARLGIPAAPGVEVRSLAAGLDAAAQIGFPVVAAPDSRVSRAAWGAGDGARYAVDRVELMRYLNLLLRLGTAHLSRPLTGGSIGLAVLCRGGEVLWAFQYRRLHELGPADGMSACRRSEPVDSGLLVSAQRLLRALSWEGPAELHFTRSNAEPLLTKISAAFAEVLPVAVAAGADAPMFLYDLELHNRRHFAARYRVGVRSRHLPSELAWTREAVWPRMPALPSGGCRRSSARFMDLARGLSPWGRWETQTMTDVRPGVYEIREVTSEVWQSIMWRLARVRQRRRMRLAARHPDELARRVVMARTIVFVCLGNIIRSAFAAGLLRARNVGGRDLLIRSAGLDASTDHPADATAVRRAQRFGVDLSTHRTRRIDRSSIEQADLLLAMELDHVVELCRRFPQHRHKVYLFGCLTGEDARDVTDPVYASEEVFDACFDRIDRGIRRIVEMLRPASSNLAATGEAR